MGLAAHAALETLDLALPEAARAEAVAAALARAHDLDEAERGEVARDLVAALARAEDESAVLRVHGRELSFCLPLRGATELFVRGRIDILAERTSRLVVRDYKYAPPAADGETYRLQLEIYALAVAAAYPGRAIDVEIEWLRAPGGRLGVPVALTTARARVEEVGAALATALVERTAAAFPQAFTAPAACTAIGCSFVARCFAATAPRPGSIASRAFRASGPSATMKS
jgi:hypothetical protein